MSETGHPINLANFGTLITAVKSMDNRYNPSDSALTLTALEALYAANKKSSEDLKDAVNDNTLAANAREALFKPLATLTRRILKAGSRVLTDAEKKDIETIARKIKGERAGTKNAQPVNPGDPKSISVSQLSYINLAGHLDSLVKLLNEIPAYAPNEDDLKIASLRDLHKSMEAANEDAAAKELKEDTTRRERNTNMYGEKDGLVDIAIAVKDYVFSSSKQGAKNPDYIAVKGIEFTRLRKK